MPSCDQLCSFILYISFSIAHEQNQKRIRRLKRVVKGHAREASHFDRVLSFSLPLSLIFTHSQIMPGSYKRGMKRRRSKTVTRAVSTPIPDEENQSDQVEDSPALRKKVRWEGSSREDPTEEDAADGENEDASEDAELEKVCGYSFAFLVTHK